MLLLFVGALVSAVGPLVVLVPYVISAYEYAREY